MKVTGRRGVDLHEQWDGNPRAYLGIVVPNFPNFFLLYGPNTNIVVNGSIIYFSECEVHYVMQCLRHLLDTKAKAIDCLPAVHDAYNVSNRRGQPADGVGCFEREQLVQERLGPRRPELALQLARVLAADP